MDDFQGHQDYPQHPYHHYPQQVHQSWEQQQDQYYQSQSQQQQQQQQDQYYQSQAQQQQQQDQYYPPQPQQHQYQHQGQYYPQQVPLEQQDQYRPHPYQHYSQQHHPPLHDPRYDRESLDSDRIAVVLPSSEDNPNQFVHDSPKEPFRLGYFDVMCLVINRMIGTGIFNSPQLVMKGTRSTGASLLFWLAGSIYCLAGTHVYIEYGLNVPRYFISDGPFRGEQAVPRSGGDLNYLQYVYRRPAYRRNTFLLSTCIFGFGFIAFGNMASNCVSFATRALKAGGAGAEPDNGATRGLAIAIAIVTCFFHAFSRRGGIWLNNLLAVVKIGILLLIIITAIVVGAGGLPRTENVIKDNTDPGNAFDRSDASHDANSYTHAFLAIVFCFSGFEQPNYVLGEISRPRRKFPIAMTAGVVMVVLLYMAVNISYMVVVPRDLQISGEGGVAQQFFALTFARLSPDSTLVPRFFNALLAISSLGNIIVMTYTAARVKQEFAKEGILPWPKFFAQNTDMSIGRVLKWFQDKGLLKSLLKWRWFRPEEHMERTPVGAFILHLIACFILIFATWGITAEKTYSLLSNLSAYTVNCFFGSFLGLGILILRFGKPPVTPRDGMQQRKEDQMTWTEMTGPSISPALSVASAVVYMVGSLWPIVNAWVPPDATYDGYEWWLLPVISWAVIGFATLWFLGFLTWARTSKRKHEVFVVEKEPQFEAADRGSASESRRKGGGGVVFVHETVFLSWVGKENVQRREADGDGGEVRTTTRMDGKSGGREVNLVGTDFEGVY